MHDNCKPLRCLLDCGVSSAGLVADIVSRVLVKLICYVEDHRSLGGSIISRLDNGAFVGLIYELLVFS